MQIQLLDSVLGDGPDGFGAVSPILHLCGDRNSQFSDAVSYIHQFHISDEPAAFLFQHGKNGDLFCQLFLYPSDLLLLGKGLVPAADELLHMLDIVDHDKIILDQTLRYRNKPNILGFKNLFHTAILAKLEIFASIAAAATSCQYSHSIPPNLHSHKKTEGKAPCGVFPLSSL